MSYRRDFREVEKEVYWSMPRIAFMIFIFAILMGGVSFGISIISRPAQVLDQATNPARVIQNYEWFYETWNDVKAMDRQIVTAQNAVNSFRDGLSEDRSEWAREDRNEYNRLNTILMGLQNQRDSVISDYNARASMITRSLFMGSDVPAEIIIVDNESKGLDY